MTFGERVLALRTEKGMTQDELALAVGYKSRSTIAKIESGERDPHQSMIAAIAKALGTTPAYLMGWDESEQSAEKNKKIHMTPYSEEGTVLVPLVGRVAAGYSCHAEENITEYIRTDSESLKNGYNYFWLQVKGDSMQPSLMEGDLVLVQMQDTLDRECYAVVTIDDEDGLVKIVDIESKKITLTSVNPYYPPRVFEKEEMNRVHVVGMVVESKRRFF